MKVQNNGILCGRRLDFFHHTSEKEWGYIKEQQDTFAVLYPKDYDETKKYPLEVVFHSAGHDVYSTIGCVWGKGNHDIYHTPEDMFGLFLDCRVHADDWWWGGINAHGEGDPSRRGVDPQPVEKRCIATVEWAIKEYNIDTDRVYAVGNSMGGSGALGIALCRGDIFAAIKVNVPAGVRHAADRCCLDTEAPEGFKIPDPPVVVDYSAQNDTWSEGHEVLFKGMKSRRYALHAYWGEFGHANNDEEIEKFNDLVHSLPILNVKKSDPYPVFTNADTDDVIPWIDPENGTSSGQVNGYFRWEVLSDTADAFEIKLWLLSPSEWQTRVTLPEKSVADLLLRRISGFKLSPGEEFKWTFGAESGTASADEAGHPSIEKLTVTQSAKVLKLVK